MAIAGVAHSLNPMRFSSPEFSVDKWNEDYSPIAELAK
jgi:hypothetical protein